MSYLNNIVFEESTLLEGEQAEAYKAKKAKEKDDASNKDVERYSNRGSSAGDKKRDPDSKDQKRKDKAEAIVNKELNKRRDEYNQAGKKYEKSIKDCQERKPGSGQAMGKAAKEWSEKNSRLFNIDGLVSHGDALDATNRHIRRHPKQYKEAVELAESLLESYQSDCIYC